MIRLLYRISPLFFAILSLALLSIGLPRVLQPPIARAYLTSCARPCAWDRVNISQFSVGDLITALGAPEFVSFTGVGHPPGRTPPGTSYFRETLFYPSLSLEVNIENWDDEQRIWPSTRRVIDLFATNGHSQLAQGWRGFATLCRYYPKLMDVCVKYG